MYTEIEELVEQGFTPTAIAKILNCPVKWAEDVWRDWLSAENNALNNSSFEDE